MFTLFVLITKAVEGLDGWDKQMLSTRAFLFVVNQVITNPFAQGVCGQLLIRRKRKLTDKEIKSL